MKRNEQNGAALRWLPASLRRLSSHPGRFYSYAPYAVLLGSTVRLWWCQNERDGVIRDGVFTGTDTGSGPLTRVEPALRHSEPGAWDSFHICDPSVVAGRFRSGEKRFGWAMFYLGNDVDASRHNQIGVAFANDPAGPWERRAEPVVGHDDPHAWGVGQPSAVCVRDGGEDGRVLLFYTQGDRDGTRVMVQKLDLSSTAAADHGLSDGPPVRLTTAGLTGRDGRPDWLNNADFALHPTTGRLFTVREQHPYPSDWPRYIGSSVQIASIALGDALRGRGAWTVEGGIGPEMTGLDRCHNAGFVRDPYGRFPSIRNVGVVFSGSRANVPVPEWTYDLYRLDGTLDR